MINHAVNCNESRKNIKHAKVRSLKRSLRLDANFKIIVQTVFLPQDSFYYLPRKSSYCIPGTFASESHTDITISSQSDELITACLCRKQIYFKKHLQYQIWKNVCFCFKILVFFEFHFLTLISQRKKYIFQWLDKLELFYYVKNYFKLLSEIWNENYFVLKKH